MMWVFGKLLAGAVWLFTNSISVFLGYIDACDAAMTVGFMWLMMTQQFHWSNGYAILLGLVVALILYGIFKTRIGFWIVSPIFSAAWAFVIVEVFVVSMCDVELSTFWGWFWRIAVFALGIWNHYCAYWREETKADIAADERAKALAKSEYLG
ncbi:MAG: hypothetical protein RSF82_03650 [Angelakisella sp.]